ncbi:MAG: phosphoenolpyruvate carboxylase [Ignavibacteriaceae bacterium]
MNTVEVKKEFEKLVKNKFEVYNSLFLNLPFNKIRDTGMFIPLLQQVCKSGLNAGKEPIEILDEFFNVHASINSEDKKIDFMFRIIQYIERQIVLYDSVEDAAYPAIQKLSNDLSLKDFTNLLKEKANSDDISKRLSEFSARIVLTAHPTQFYSHAVLDIMSRLRTLILQNDINGIDLTLQQLGLTSLVNSQKPTPFDEAKNIIYFLRNVYYDAVGEIYSHIKNILGNKKFDNTNIIRIGFWPGGDRDGNPFVTSDVTIKVADELRMSLMKCYYRDVKILEQKMTFRKVESLIAGLRSELYTSMFDSTKIISVEEILTPLYKIRKFIIEEYNQLYLEMLEDLINKVKIFKTHFAVLDVRQNHEVHRNVIEDIFRKEGLISQNLSEIEESELIDLLLHKKIKINPDLFDDKIVKDTLINIIQLNKIQVRNGEDGCSRYIISNSEDIFSVLFVYALFRWCWKSEKINFDIVPLFESMQAMNNSEKIMKSLFSLANYRNHLKRREDSQTIMLGFSDGTKDGGYLKANWAIFKTKENLSALCKRNKIKVIFFDGRGGPPARGGGKTNKFYATQSETIANNEIQLTLQGQTITSKYGTKEHFINNMEQMLTAGLSNKFFSEGNKITDKSRKIIEELAQISFAKYQALKNHEKFLPYLEKKSTLKYYGETKIGSRPAKRGSKNKLEFEDLRAISFVGSWSQLKQNVPGFFGVGSALKKLADKGKLSELKNIFNEVPFFKVLMLNSMMSLSKCNFELTEYFKKDKEFKGFWKILYDEYKLSRKMLLKISGLSEFMEEEPVSGSSIAIREQIVLPLLVIQQYAMQKIELNSKQKNVYEKIVKRSLYGNINASRNSA